MNNDGKTEKIKTHWLESPNKNYLGHWDLPNGEDVVLTIKTVQWEDVKNPATNKIKRCKVIRFEENYSWLKPFISNHVNCENILISTGTKFTEDCCGKRIKLYVSKYDNGRNTVDCIRVRTAPQIQVDDKLLSADQSKEISDLIEMSGRKSRDILNALGVEKIEDLPANKYSMVKKRLLEIVNGGG